ncbi:uncharacterized protein L3040_001402 [Drepanopeziza brunnea f. sp. 'multigermtubi']|uniref:uncharacterized protein n=1 Tax=Drepanopeziza brunnea f. sp. 'multigermtubi' TaxID=698441 RepID=UPI0023A745FF|nr:hypothetical protein L3040_001402 [Drepanopeziza brunnea f. sp. 'multigermtubi']
MTKSKGGDKSHHDNVHAPSLYILDLGLMNLENTVHSGKVLTKPYPTGSTFLLKQSYLLDKHRHPRSERRASKIMYDVQTVIKSGVHTPEQLIIDQENDKLYFCDREGLCVMRANFDGTQQETLIQNGNWEKREGRENHLD